MITLLKFIEAFTPWYILDFIIAYWGYKEIQKGVKEGQIRTKADKLFFLGVWAYGVIIIAVIPIVLALTS